MRYRCWLRLTHPETGRPGGWVVVSKAVPWDALALAIGQSKRNDIATDREKAQPGAGEDYCRRCELVVLPADESPVLAGRRP